MLSLEGKPLGNYDVIRRIRVGGMGAVYEGRQRTAFDRRVAIKVILGNYADDREMRRRFAREARTVARLHHPHVLPLIEFGDEQGILYLVMPFIDGGTLTSYLRQSLPDLAEVAAIYQQLLDAVEYAHDEGLIHRDIKSSNVLLEMRRSGPPYVYLADFGLVRTLRQAEGEQTGKAIPLDQVPGTPHYMAPEQTRGIVTPQTDIYALGVLLYQLLTGELPYNDDDDIRVIQMHLSAPIPLPGDADSSIPAELDEVVRNAMAKRQEARYKSVGDLRSAFLAAMSGPSDDVPVVVSPEEPIVGNTGRSLATLPLMPDMPAPIIIPRRATRSSALQPLPLPKHPSTKLSPYSSTTEAKTGDVGARKIGTRDAAVRRDGDGRELAARQENRPRRNPSNRRIVDAQPNVSPRPNGRPHPNAGARSIGAPPNVGARFINPPLPRTTAQPNADARRNGGERSVGAPFISPSPARPPAPPSTSSTSPASLASSATVRITDSVKETERVRPTGIPFGHRSRRVKVALFASIIVPIVLIILLIMPRVLGVSIFPSGFPLLGTPPIATVVITTQSKTVQDTYVLSASPQVMAVDINGRIIPGQALKASVTGKRTVPTTGSKIIAGIQARGTVELTNNSLNAIFVPAQTTLTSARGIRFQTVQDVQIPPRGQENKVNITVIAMNIGVAGNIAVGALNGPCCGDNVTMKNNAPFSGGIDAQSVHMVAQADLDGVRNALALDLQKQASQQLTKQITGDEASSGKPVYNTDVVADSPVGTQTDQVQVTITLAGTLATYNHVLAASTAMQLLNQQATRTLGHIYQEQSTPTVGNITVVDVNKDGIVYLSVPVHGMWMYNLGSQQVDIWSQSIRGSTTAAAIAYLGTQPGVAGADIHLPFGTDHLPTSSEEIRIVLVGGNNT